MAARGSGNFGHPLVLRERGPLIAPFMLSIASKSALALAGLGLALIGVPAVAAAQPAYAPDEIVVGIEGEPARVQELAPGTSVNGAIAGLERDPAVEFAQPNWIARTALTPLDRGTSGKPGGWTADQWSFLGRPGGIRIERAWDRLLDAGAPGGAGTTVAIVDTGLAYAPAVGSFLPSPDFAPAQFVPGIDLVDDDGEPLDENGHGTHVAGTIAEQVTLGQPAGFDDYLTGIAYGARLMPVRVLDRAGAGTAADVGEGILWAARNGADIINVALQFDAAVTGCKQVPTVCRATRKAQRHGALVIAAAGNALTGNGKRRAMYPGAAPGVFAVGATTEHGCLAAYSHFRKRTDLLAPGGGEPRPAASHAACAGDRRPVLQLSYDCFPTCSETYERFSIRPDLGTSMAAAHASGVAALVRASGVSGADPRPKRLAERLTCTSRPGPTKRFYDDGVLDALRATDPGRKCGGPKS
ncbi:MAG: peptidase and subtilisin kexin sedolisin [Geminicoccaceae bacterium]|nr:peptidase and subtilisin kexin sedolisin [Solirubrobacterales bacterium]MCE3246204.1 peptidase and subtilisin kexin sedolisin [Geminicoccaceae bacterium]